MGYTTDLGSVDAFLRAILMAAQANPDPTSWSPIASSTGARDAVLFAGGGLHTLHFDENGVVTSSHDGVSQQPSPNSDPTAGGAGSLALAVESPSGAVAGGLDASPAGDGLPSGGGSPTPALDLPVAGASQAYTAGLASVDAFLRDVLTAAQANPDPSSWSPIASSPSAQDAMLLAANGLQRLHFDENGAVTPGADLSQQPSPSGALTSGPASPPVLTLDTGAGAGAVPAFPLDTGAGSGAAPGIPAGGLPSGGGSPTPPSAGASGGVYSSDLSAADPVLRQVLELLQSNSDPTTWPAIEGVAAAQDLVVFGPNGGVSGLHIDDQGDATPSPLEGFGSPIDLGIPGANIGDHGASGSGWLLDI
jgi:hypothetical protein